MRRVRLTVTTRVVLILCAIAAFSTGLALLLQDRALSRDLGRAARERLANSAFATDRLIEKHLASFAARYRAVSGTPQFRANLEVGHTPTLAYYARRLQSREGADLILFAGRGGRVRVSAGDERLLATATERLRLRLAHSCEGSASREARVSGPPLAPCSAQGDRPGRAPRDGSGYRGSRADCAPAWADLGAIVREQARPDIVSSVAFPAGAECRMLGETADASLIAHAGDIYAFTAIPLRARGRSVGYLVALEGVTAEVFAGWSELCGCHVTLAAHDWEHPAELQQAVRWLDRTALRVVRSLRADRGALENSRRTVLAAGLAALVVAFAASFVLAAGLVRPILEIKGAAERIGRGDLTTRLEIHRSDEIGEVAGAFNLMLDRLGKSQGRLANAQRLARLGSWEVDLASGELHCSDEFRRIYEIGDEDTVTNGTILNRVHHEDRDRVRAALEACAETGVIFSLDYRIVKHDGSERILHSQGERISDAGLPTRLEGTVQDVTERKLVEDEVRYLAYHDNLTGLENRPLFKDCLALSIERARRQSSPVAVLFLDLDHFKVINDTLGHSVGDQLLRGVADRLVRAVGVAEHPADKHGGEPPRAVARFGGDEFTIRLADIEKPRDASDVAQHILEVIADPFDLDGNEVVITGSIGITVWPDDGEDVEALLRNCDTAMYHAKKRGRNNHQCYTEAMQADAFKRLIMQSKLRRAIEREEFELRYQPKVDIQTGRVTGLEALVRWRDPEVGIVLPDDFIPMAEESGFIVAIGEWVLYTAASQARVWQQAGFPEVHVSVNLSPHQIEGGGLIDTVVDVLETTGLDPRLLDLEITESTLMEDEDTAIALLHVLKDLGISISLDDFGTGYSSLSYLRRLPIDTLKIDRSFVRRVATDATDVGLASAIISMAKVLGLRVVVEGVETEAQRDVLEELGCDEIQGYLYSEPVPADQIMRVLETVRPKGRSRVRTRVRRPRKRLRRS